MLYRRHGGTPVEIYYYGSIPGREKHTDDRDTATGGQDNAYERTPSVTEDALSISYATRF